MSEPPERLRERLLEAGLDLEADDVLRTVKHKPMTRGVLRLNDHFAKVFPDPDSYDESVRAPELTASPPFPNARRHTVGPGCSHDRASDGTILSSPSRVGPSLLNNTGE